ncbi:MAG TPA: methyltransferase domain-containing protein [Bacteroidota bacterium]
MPEEKEYVLGTHDDEITRLGLQHRVWRPRALDAWRRAGFTSGQTILDIGCGPGYASLDLAEIVGPAGKVVAIDKSRRFLDALGSTQRQRGLTNIVTNELDLDSAILPAIKADGAWARWIFAFVRHPRELLARAAKLLNPGGVFVIHEYIDYSTWRLAPGLPALEEYVQAVMESWRADGGEPDIGRELPSWLNELGFELKTLNPIVDIVPASNYVWQWPKAFIEVGIQRLVDLGRMTQRRAGEILAAFAEAEQSPNTLMITPLVLEIIAVRG